MTRDKIIEQLKLGALTTEELMRATGLSYDTIHNSAKRLFKAGKLVKIKSGNRWAITGTTGNATIVADQKALLKKVGKTLRVAGKDVKIVISTPPPAPRKLVNRFVIVVDNSSSMQSVQQEVLDGLNSTISTIRSESIRSGQETEISLYYFADTARPATYFRAKAQDFQRIYSYSPYGNTALFDAVIKGINEHLIPERADENVSTVVIVLTDGADNRSQDRYGRQMNELIRRVQGTDRWTITFQLPPNTKSWFCSQFAVPQGNVQEWERTTQGVLDAAFSRDLGTRNYYGLRAQGINSSKNFYTTDLSKLDPGTLKAKLTDIRSQVKVWEVPGEVDIQSFVQTKSGSPYVRGTIFYQLTKPEEIQDYKKVLVMEKNARGVYAGDEAKRLIGITGQGDAKVKVGNHSNFDVFVQSTSVNRKLVRGTKVVSWPKANG